MSSGSESSPPKRQNRSKSEQKQSNNKLFITNLDGKADTRQLETQLRSLFEKCGIIQNITVKRNRNSQYCFAFVQMKEHSAAIKCVENYDRSLLAGKQIKVQFQDDQKRRKDSNKGCYNCGKMGHFARECHSTSRNDNNYRSSRRRSRSRSQDSDRHRKKRRRRSRSDSSDRGRSRSPKSKKDKQKRNKSKDRDEKKKKRHKRSYSSES